MLRLIGSLMLLFSLAIMPVNPAYSASADDARNFVDSLGKEVLSVINSGGDEAQKQQKLRDMFAQNVDLDWMGQFVLGRGGQQASEQERASYLQAYREYMLARYTTSFPDYIGANYSIIEVKNAADNQFIVNLHVKSSQGKDIYAGYRLRPEGNGFKVTDIIVENVSQLTTQRAEFGGLIQQKGIAELTKAIQAKTSQWKK